MFSALPASWLCPWTDAMGTTSPSYRDASWSITVTIGHERPRPAGCPVSQHYSGEVKHATYTTRTSQEHESVRASFPRQRSSCHFLPTSIRADSQSKEEALLQLPFCQTN